MEDIKKTSVEEKLKVTIETMRSALAQEGDPQFKTFWTAREECLELLKESMPAPVRTAFWEQYRDLTDEARRLKEHFEEESEFAVEQIDIAIQALEGEIKEFDAKADEVSFDDFPKNARTLALNMQKYVELQKKLVLLNTQATRTNALRKELASTKMRARRKSRYFERLSAVGDFIFPKRKELIQEVSDLFVQDVGVFVRNEGHLKSLKGYREEIKALQSAAKVLTLNTQAFSETRKQLSHCWDKMRDVEKERKKEYDSKKEVFEKNAEEVRSQITEFKEKYAAEKPTVEQAQKQVDEIFKLMKEKELGRDEVKSLHDEIAEAKKPLVEAQKEEEKKKKQLELEREEKRQARIKEVEDAVMGLQENPKEALSYIETLKADIQSLGLSDIEQDKLMSSLSVAENIALEKEEEALVKEGKKSEALEKKLRRRELIKENYDNYRKLAGQSGLDFEQSLALNGMVTEEKERLDRINKEIGELE